jgi:hypothetical protein
MAENPSGSEPVGDSVLVEADRSLPGSPICAARVLSW